MAMVQLHIEDDTLHLTLKTMLTFAGHAVTDVPVAGAVHIADGTDRAMALVGQGIVLVLSTASELPMAIKTMEVGVWGYIFLPLVPGEASLMVTRATEQGNESMPPDQNAPSRTLESVEQEHILDTLRQSRYNRAEAARRLGIGRNTLWRKLKQYDLESK